MILGPMGSRLSAGFRSVFALGVWLSSGALAKAQSAPPQLAGSWRAGATVIEVQVESWGGDCGPRPQSSKSGGGGVVTLAQDGKALIIRGRDQDIRSDACWSRNPSMRKQSSSLVDNVWTTQCKTAANDPREEHGTYLLKLMSPDTLLYQDKSRYNWALNTSKCVATFTTTQTLTRVTAGASAAPAAKPATPPPAPPPAPAPKPAEPVERVCTPGAPARITLRPKRAEIEVGQRTCFRARVADASDCVIPSPVVEWSLSHSRALRGELADGCFTAARTTAEAEGEFKVIAQASGLRGEATVVVRSVDLSALIAKRMEGDAVQGFEEQTAPAAATSQAAARIATRSVGEPAQSKGTGRVLWLAGLGGALLLGIGAFALKRRAVRVPVEAAEGLSEEPDSARISETRAKAAARPDSQPSAPPTPSAATASREPWICPLCRVGYPPEQKTCPRDGSALMPYAEFNKRTRETAEGRKKRCPKCGDSFPASSAFCGKDGSSLVDA